MTVARTREALRPAQRRLSTRVRASQHRLAMRARTVWRRVFSRATAALAVTVAGVATVYSGIAGWSQDLALVFVGVTLMIYGLLFIDLDGGPRRRGRG